MTAQVDSYKFIRGVTKRLTRTWISQENPTSIPWTPLAKPLKDCRVAMISSGGIALKDDSPFDQEGERQDPWWGDPGYRIIPRGTKTTDIRVYHLHINPAFAEEDLNCLLPLQRLDELAEAGLVADSALNHYSYMGYLIDPTEFLRTSVPAMIEKMREEAVDVVVLVPS